MSIEARGYGEADKYVCSGCVKDHYLQNVIRTKGQYGACSFCKDAKGKPIHHRKVYPLEALMSEIKHAIDHYYMSTDGNIPYDGETKEYLGSFIDPYDFVYSVLAAEMQVEESGRRGIRRSLHLWSVQHRRSLHKTADLMKREI